MTGAELLAQVREAHSAVGEALTITRGGTVQMPKAHWDRIIAAGLNLKPALDGCILLTKEEAAAIVEEWEYLYSGGMMGLRSEPYKIALLTPEPTKEDA